ncbi:MAG: MogA/MoaB family molybdenum cofactor biosynthesis protein [Candidatus Sumerlaeia bacterium]|nr:MogA/MoaB family molybdenum cofactor biosynthesis protein [Candidatus Sumerlaeia bacterium]
MASPSTTAHREGAARAEQSVRVAVLTISDTRTEATDTSGARIRELLVQEGHQVAHYAVLPDEPELIREQVTELVNRAEVQVVLLNGGTGIAPRDGTFEAIDGMLEQRLPGFGELFRMLSWNEVGAASMLSRAVAGLVERTLVFSMPGSTNAVNLAMTKLILPELRHLVHEVAGRPQA